MNKTWKSVLYLFFLAAAIVSVYHNSSPLSRKLSPRGLESIASSVDFMSAYAMSEFADFRIDMNLITRIVTNTLDTGVLFNGSIIFVKTDYLDRFIEAMDGIRLRFIVITHGSDLSVPSETHDQLLQHRGLIRWFAVNAVKSHPLITAIPLGVTYGREFYDPLSNLYTNSSVAQVLPPFKNRTKLIYARFTITTNAVHRRAAMRAIYNRFGNRSDVDYGTIESRMHYLHRLRDVKFVISPPGNGIDCFRTWEALAMGCVPIVLNTSINAVYRAAPVMIVNRWEEITDASLAEFEKGLKLDAGGVLRSEIIFANYWRRKIVESRDADRKRKNGVAKCEQ